MRKKVMDIILISLRLQRGYQKEVYKFLSYRYGNLQPIEIYPEFPLQSLEIAGSSKL